MTRHIDETWRFASIGSEDGMDRIDPFLDYCVVHLDAILRAKNIPSWVFKGRFLGYTPSQGRHLTYYGPRTYTTTKTSTGARTDGITSTTTSIRTLVAVLIDAY